LGQGKKKHAGNIKKPRSSAVFVVSPGVQQVDFNHLNRFWELSAVHQHTVKVFLVGQRFTLADVAASIPLYCFQQEVRMEFLENR
jgi:glutathione S-transferase